MGNNVALQVGGFSLITDPPVSAPTFPGPIGLSATASAGTPSFVVGSNLAAAPTGYAFMVSATKQLSPGISFVGKSQFRSLSSFPDTDFASIDILAAYNVLFGSLVAGAVIGVQLRLIEIASGFQNLAASEVIVVGA